MLKPWPQFSCRVKECGLGAINQTGETTERENRRTGFGGGLECWPAAPSPLCTNSYTFRWWAVLKSICSLHAWVTAGRGSVTVGGIYTTDNMVSYKEPEIYQHEGSFEPIYVSYLRHFNCKCVSARELIPLIRLTFVTLYYHQRVIVECICESTTWGTIRLLIGLSCDLICSGGLKQEHWLTERCLQWLLLASVISQLSRSSFVAFASGLMLPGSPFTTPSSALAHMLAVIWWALAVKCSSCSKIAAAAARRTERVAFLFLSPDLSVAQSVSNE